MKFLSLICLCLLPYCLLAQPKSIGFHLVDSRVFKVDETRADSLAYKLTAPYTNQLDKVRSIFRWITENIEYQARPYYTYLRNQPLDYWAEDVTDTGALKPLDERIADMVLQRRVALCDGYARLFKTLCDYSGIRAEVILGYARTGRGKFQSNHRWNAVMIDSTWHLLDATWASGFITYGGNYFVKQLDEQYFLASPQNFVQHHYPEDLKWTLLQKPPMLSEFRSSPFRHQSFNRHNITNYAPRNGIIEAKPGDTLVFELETRDVEKRLWVSDSVYLDSATIAGSAWITTDLTDPRGKKARAHYVVTNAAIEWLHVILNNEAVLRYKINVKKDFTAAN